MSTPGWQIVPGYGHASLGTLNRIAGSKNILSGDVLTVMDAFCAAFAREVEPIVRADSWGYAPRKIAGSETWSTHAQAIAVDLNASKRPQFRDTYTPEAKAAIRRVLARFPVIRWGGDYPAARRDQMHYELNASPAAVAALAKALGGAAVSTGMVSPVKGYASSEYGLRSGILHAGLDIATGGKPVAVYAAFGGVLSNVVRDRVHDRTASQPKNRGKAVVVAGRTGNGARITNPDGEVQVYIHLALLSSLGNGRVVKAGQLLGFVDLSGNTSGYHLHLETWSKAKATRNPRLYFAFHGLAVGSERVTSTPPAPAPAPAPTPAPAPAPSGPTSDPYVLAWQKRQNHYGNAGLIEDGVYGAKSQTWQNWTKQLQTALGAWLASQRLGALVRDGDYAAETKRHLVAVQKANPGKFGPVADAVVGKYSVAALGIPPKPYVGA